MSFQTLERNEFQRQRAWELSRLSTCFELASTRELFYGENEKTYVIKKVKGFNPRPELVLSNVPFYPDNVGGAKKGDEETKKSDPDVVLYVPICCRDCQERITVPISAMEGVKSIECDILKKKVVVSGKALNATDILLECRSKFRKAAFWKDD